jgi:hypothetical protein
MAHSLSVVTRNTFHEFGIFHGSSNAENAVLLRQATGSAAQRYLLEMAVVEDFLSDHGLPGKEEDLEHEREQILFFSTPASSDDEVQLKAAAILDEFVPRHVSTRLERLYALVNKLRDGNIPSVVQRSSAAIRLAYQAMRVPGKCRRDAAQDALVILATHNWKPKPVPEYLPLLHYQTVARIRNKVLKRLSEAELFVFKHQQSDLDLESFLIVTALLHGAQDEDLSALNCK